MRPELFAFYGGPDQIMGVASGLAAALGALLMFWNKILVAFGKLTRRFRSTGESENTSHDAS